VATDASGWGGGVNPNIPPTKIVRDIKNDEIV